MEGMREPRDKAALIEKRIFSSAFIIGFRSIEIQRDEL